jgi:hypothetical protein
LLPAIVPALAQSATCQGRFVAYHSLHRLECVSKNAAKRFQASGSGKRLEALTERVLTECWHCANGAKELETGELEQLSRILREKGIFPERLVLVLPLSQIQPAEPPEQPESESKWACGACTFLNEQHALQCEVCDLERRILENAEMEAMRQQLQQLMMEKETAEAKAKDHAQLQQTHLQQKAQLQQQTADLQKLANDEKRKREVLEAELKRREEEEREHIITTRHEWDELICPLEMKEQLEWEWDGPKQRYKRVPLFDDNEFYDCIKDAWRRKNGKGKKNHLKIKRVELVENMKLREQFGIGIHTMETRRLGSALFNEQIEDDGEKRSLVERLKGHFEAVASLEMVNVVYAWHGCSHSAADEICSLGGADLRKTDGGYFGAGIYVTPHAEYAAGHYSIMNEPNTSGEYVALLCLVSIGNAYPISRETDYVNKADINSALSVSKYHYAHPIPAGATLDFLQNHENRQDKVLKAGFDAHFASISVSHNFQAVGPNIKHDYDEIVLKEERQVLPIAKIYFHS